MGIVVQFDVTRRHRRLQTPPVAVTMKQVKESIKTLLACFEEALDEAFDDAQTVETKHD